MGISRGATKRFFRSVARLFLEAARRSGSRSGQGMKGKTRVILCTPVAGYAILLDIRRSPPHDLFAIRSSIVLSVSSFPRESSHDGDRRAGTLLSPISSKLFYALILIEIRRGRERHVRRTACRLFAASLFTRHAAHFSILLAILRRRVSRVSRGRAESFHFLQEATRLPDAWLSCSVPL